MEVQQTTSEIIELSMLEPTEINEGESDDVGDEAGTDARQAPPTESLADAQPHGVGPVHVRLDSNLGEPDNWRQRFRPDLYRAAQPHGVLRERAVSVVRNAYKPQDNWSVIAPEMHEWEGLSAPPADLTPPAAQLPPCRIAVPAYFTQGELHFNLAHLKEFICPGFGLPHPINRSLKIVLWAEGFADGCLPFPCVLTRKCNGKNGALTRFKSLRGAMRTNKKAHTLEFEHLGSTPPPHNGTESERIYHLSVKRIGGVADSSSEETDSGSMETGNDVRALAADAWPTAGMTATPADLAPPAGIKVEHENDAVNGGGAMIVALPGTLVPPLAAVPPARIDIPAYYSPRFVCLSKSFMTDFFCPGTGLAYPLEDSVDLCLWAEGPSGRVAFHRRLTMACRCSRIAFPALGEHLGVYSIDNACALEFALLGSSPPTRGPTVYHLSVKKVEYADEDCPVHAAAMSPAKKPGAVPWPIPAVAATTPPLAKNTKAPPALLPAAESPSKKHKSAPSVTAPVSVPAAANMQLRAAPNSLILKACTEGLKEAEQVVQVFRDVPGGLPPSDLARHERLDRASLDVATGRARELWAGSGIYVAQGIHGLLAAATPEWCGARVPPLSRPLLDTPQLRRAGISDSLSSVLQGRPPHRLWVGPVGDGGSASQVISLGAIPAGSWVMQVPGEYVFGEAAVAASFQPTARFIGNGSGGSGGGCIVPYITATTAEQQHMCSNCAVGRHDRDSDPRWRRLGDTALDFSGTVAAFIQGPASDANLDVVDIDLPTGPTGVFLVACRDILPGERLVAALN